MRRILCAICLLCLTGFAIADVVTPSVVEYECNPETNIMVNNGDVAYLGLSATSPQTHCSVGNITVNGGSLYVVNCSVITADVVVVTQEGTLSILNEWLLNSNGNSPNPILLLLTSIEIASHSTFIVDFISVQATLFSLVDDSEINGVGNGFFNGGPGEGAPDAPNNCPGSGGGAAGMGGTKFQQDCPAGAVVQFTYPCGLPGSSGGMNNANFGAKGGGAFCLQATSMITVSGYINMAGGLAPFGGGGGGAGGTISLLVPYGQLSVSATSRFNVAGGSSSAGGGSPGGGGYIFTQSQNVVVLPSSVINVAGGTGDEGGAGSPPGNGTVLTCQAPLPPPPPPPVLPPPPPSPSPSPGPPPPPLASTTTTTSPTVSATTSTTTTTTTANPATTTATAAASGTYTAGQAPTSPLSPTILALIIGGGAAVVVTCSITIAVCRARRSDSTSRGGRRHAGNTDAETEGAARPLLDFAEGSTGSNSVTRASSGVTTYTSNTAAHGGTPAPLSTSSIGGDKSAPLRVAIDTGGVKQIDMADLEIVKELGKGGFGTVFRVRHRKTFTDMAFKKFNTLTSSTEVMMFLQEASVHAALHHPHCLSLLGIVVTPEGIGLLTPLMKQDLARARATFSMSARYLAVTGAARGLAYLHSCGITHADIKPQNVLVDEHGNAVLADFGLAGIKAQYGYTEQYAAPELFTGARPDTLTDIYALGCVIIETLTDTRPYGGVTNVRAAAKEGTLPFDAATIRALKQTSAVLGDVAMRCVDRVRGDRPSVSDILLCLPDVAN